MSDYIVHDSSLAAVADAIRTQTGRSGALEFPVQFASEINSLALKRGVLRHDAELIHTVSYDAMLVADEGNTIPAYTSTETMVRDAERIIDMTVDVEAYDYLLVERALTIPIYSVSPYQKPYWHEYHIVCGIYEFMIREKNLFKAISSDDTNTNLASNTYSITGNSILSWGKAGTDFVINGSAAYGLRQVLQTPSLTTAGLLRANNPRVYIRGAASSFPQACWEDVEDARLQYVFDVYRIPKGRLNLDGWAYKQAVEFCAECVNSADHKLR